VRGRPIGAWNVKDMVAIVVKSRLAQDLLEPAELNSEAAATNSEPPSGDPWANIFPPPPTSSRPGTSSLDGSPSDFGVYDAEDQVYRCLDCVHEIWGGSCSRCGRHYRGHDIDTSDDNSSSEEHYGLSSMLPVMERVMGWPRSVSEDESDNGSYEASFIDDEDSERHHSEVVEIFSDDNDDSIQTTELAMTRGREGGDAQIAFSEDDEDRDERISDIGGTDEPPIARRRPAFGTRMQVLSDSDVDNSRGYSTKSEDSDSSGIRSIYSASP